MRAALTCLLSLAILVALAVALDRRSVVVQQQLARADATVTLAPGDTLVQRFAPRRAVVSTITVHFAGFQGSPSALLRLTLRDPRGRVVGSWDIAPPALATGRFSTGPIRLEPGTYELAFALAAPPNRVAVSGWALDTTAREGTGVDRVLLFLDGPPGAGQYLGAATYGANRPDVADAFGSPRYAPSGWQFVWDVNGVGGGRHTLYLYAHSSVSNTWTSLTRIVNVNAPARAPGTATAPDRDGAGPSPQAIAPPGDIRMFVDLPAADATFGPAATVALTRGTLALDPTGSMTLSGQPQAGNLDLAITSSVSARDYLAHYAAAVTAGRSTPAAALLLGLHTLWLLGLLAIIGTIGVLTVRREA